MSETNITSIDKSRQEKPIKPIDPITVKKVNLIGDILINWGEDNDFATFINPNLEALGYFLWDIGKELEKFTDEKVYGG